MNYNIMNIFQNVKLLFISFFIWTSIISLPLILTYNDLYLSIFPLKKIPSYIGLILGISSVIIGHSSCLVYFYIFKNVYSPTFIQKKETPNYIFKDELLNHLCRYEGFIIINLYLIITWIFKILPLSYYSFNGGIIWTDVLSLLLLQDFIQYLIHILEHKLNIELYRISHKHHHRFINPKLFDAFNGSIFDTFLMIIIPLLLTTQFIKTNVWSYMTFGSLYANWLTFIHSEYSHPWEKILFRHIGFGTAIDHHVHHKFFVYNYGHLFMYWDKIFGTYRKELEL